MTDKTPAPTTPPTTLAALIRAASGFAYEIAAGIKSENAEAAQALAMVFADDPKAEFHVGVRLTPDKAVVLSVVVGGKQFIVYHADLPDEPAVTH